MILIFDIGKTNKKALVFDQNYQVKEETQRTFDEVADMDGDPTDDVLAISSWIKETIKKYQSLGISHINFTTYGATLAHLDKDGKLLANPFNYLKPIDKRIKAAFLNKYGGATDFCVATASPDLDFLLNSGFQLYWLKYAKPDFFNKIHTTLHLPQYFSYLLTGQKVSEYTSIGCHTMLWDFEKKQYHDWLKIEGMINLLAPPQLSPKGRGTRDSENRGRATLPPLGGLRGDFGLHDSSAALLPYLHKETKPFLLLSTGTWSICLNPFNKEPLTAEEFSQDCLFYMRPDGESVKASRLFLGKIHDEAVEKLCTTFQQQPEAIRTVFFNNDIYNKLIDNQLNKNNIKNWNENYHLLMYDLIKIQVQKIHLAAGKTLFEKIIIDGGFAKNDLFLNMLKKALPNVKIEASEMAQGTALGAALALKSVL
jgi:sugar (pentulose or hexulose) kinase